MAEKFKISASNDKDAESVEIEFNFGANLDEAIDLFEPAAIHGYFVKGAKVALQANLRKMLKEGKNQEELQAYADSWIPGVKASRVSGKATPAKLLDMFSKLSPEEKAEMLKQLAGTNIVNQ